MPDVDTTWFAPTHQRRDGANAAALRVVPPPVPRRRRWGPALLVGAVVVAVLAAVAVLVLPGPVEDRPPVEVAGPPPAPSLTPSTSPAEVLNGLADRAAEQPPVDEGRYDYLRLRQLSPGQPIVVPDGATGPGRAQSTTERERWTGSDDTGQEVWTLDDQPPVHVTRPDLRRVDVPTDPAAIGRLLSEPRAFHTTPVPYFSLLELWCTQVVGPQDQAALLRYLATRDDVRVAGPTTDHLGRQGVEVRMAERYRLDTAEVEREDEFRLVFDTGTGSLLSAETLIVDGPRQGPAVRYPFSETVILWLETGRVDSIGQRPSGS